MSRMLASVSSLEEALFIQAYDVDIIDLKQPAQGALGALPVADVAEIVARLGGSHTVSATIGDLPMQPDAVFSAVQAMAETGVDYVKIGFFPGGDWPGCLNRLAGLAAPNTALIAVLFADTRPNLNWIAALQRAGFSGVMLDTMDKSLGSLMQLMPLAELNTFVRSAKAAGLLTGLAGSLNQSDIPALLPLQADYLGFRGALCQRHQRTATLEPARIASLRQMMHHTHADNSAELA